LRRAAPWAAAESLFSATATLLSTLAVARLLTPSDFGLASIAFAVVAIVQMLAFAGVPQAMLRVPHLTPRLSDQSFQVLLGLGMLGTLACWLLAAPLARFYGTPLLFWLIGIQGLDCLLQALVQFPTTLLTRKMRTRSLALRMLWFKAVSIAATLSAAAGNLGAWSLVIGSLAGSLASIVLLWRTQPRLPRWRRFDGSLVPLLRMGWLIMAETALTALAVRGFVLLFGKFHGLHDLGLLNFAMRLVDELGAMITASVGRVSLSFFATAHRAGHDLARIFEIGTHAITLAVLPLFFGLAAVAGDAVPLVFGARWVAAVPAVQLLAIFWGLRLTRLLGPGLMRTLGIQGPLVVNAAISFGFAIAAVLLTRDLGFVAAVAAFSARMLVTIPAGAGALARAAGLPVSRQLRAVAWPLVLAGTMAMLVLGGRVLASTWPAAPRLAALTLGGALLYALLLWTFDRRGLTRVASLRR
jgi:PST family polysaccharide transporter